MVWFKKIVLQRGNWSGTRESKQRRNLSGTRKSSFNQEVIGLVQGNQSTERSLVWYKRIVHHTSNWSGTREWKQRGNWSGLRKLFKREVIGLVQGNQSTER